MVKMNKLRCRNLLSTVALIGAGLVAAALQQIAIDPDIAEYARRRLAVELDPPARLPSPTLTLFD